MTSAGKWFGNPKTYQYDAAGRRTRMDWGDGFYVTYDYKADGSLATIKENGSAALATYAYDADGRRSSLTYGNGAVTSYAYDPVSRLSTLTSNLSGTANDLTTTFQYNPASQISELTRSNNSYAWQDHYNVDRPSTVNGLNQLTTAGSLNLSYDNNGNLTDDGDGNTYTYDIENRLLTGPGGATLSYDPHGRLIITNGGQTDETRLDYDGADLVAEYDSSNVMLRRYVHGPGSDDPILWYEGSGTSDKRYLHKDERGSVIAVTNSSGGVVGINSYDDHGIPASTNIGRFQYTGQQYLSDLGLYHYKARVYSPTLGRFLQTDPIGYGDGMNLYAYVGGDPINKVDPTGLCVYDPDNNVIITDCGGGGKGDTIIVTGTRIAGIDFGAAAGLLGGLGISNFVGGIGAPGGPAGSLQPQPDCNDVSEGTLCEIVVEKSKPKPSKKGPPTCLLGFLERGGIINPTGIVFHDGTLPGFGKNSVTIYKNIYLAGDAFNRTDEAAIRHKFHELGHVRQYSTGTKLRDHIVGYAHAGSHDSARLEQDAQAFADSAYAAYVKTGLHKTCPF